MHLLCKLLHQDPRDCVALFIADDVRHLVLLALAKPAVMVAFFPVRKDEFEHEADEVRREYVDAEYHDSLVKHEVLPHYVPSVLEIDGEPVVVVRNDQSPKLLDC